MVPVVPLLAALAGTPASACGQSTHVWIGIEATDALPEGELRDLLERPELFPNRVLGAMFPDGGYSPLTQDGYGESAHWEPLQTAYLAWIKDRYDPPYDGEAAAHVAFLMGMAAHGMADQVFDGVFLTRSMLYDGEAAWGAYQADLATDIAMTAQVGPMPLVDDVIPYDALVEVFEAYGQPTPASTMRTGTASLMLALQYTSNAGQNPETADEFTGQFPWASENLTDPDVPGSPAMIRAAVAGYWQTLWDRLHDRYDPVADAVFFTWPPDGAVGHPTDPLDLETQVAVALSRAVDETTLTPDNVRWLADDGTAVPVEFRMYYGNGSNVLLVWPTAPLVDDAAYTITLGPGITSFDGVVLDGTWSTRLATGDGPATCGCATAPAGSLAWLALLLWPWRRRR